MKRKAAIILILALTLMPLAVLADDFDDLQNELESQITGCPDFEIEAPATGGQTVDASTFGLSESNTGKQNYEALKNAIEYCRSNKAYKLVVPKGRYKVGEYKKGEVRGSLGIIDFEQMEDFIFDGQGSEFVMQRLWHFITITNSKRCEFKNFSIEWDYDLEPVQSVGELTFKDPNGEFIEIKFEKQVTPDMFLNTKEMVEIDKEKRLVSAEGEGLIGAYRFKLTPEGVQQGGDAHTIRFYHNVALAGWFNITKLEEGQMFAVRHHSYTSHGIVSFNSENFVLDNIRIYSTLGHGILSWGGTHRYAVMNSRLERKEGQGVFASGADGFHITNTRGYLKFINNVWAHSGDDLFNINDTMTRDIEIVNQNTILAKNSLSWRNPVEVGNKIELRKADYSPIDNAIMTVKSVEYDASAATCKLEFEESIPPGVEEDAILFYLYYDSSNYIVKDNQFRDNRGRGMVVAGSNATIENNQYINNYYPGMLIRVEVDNRWSEGRSNINVIVRGNTFKDSDKFMRYANYPGALSIYSVSEKYKYASFSITGKMLIENNTIENCPWNGIYLRRVDGAIVRNNVLNNTNLTDNPSVSGAILIDQCKNLFIKDNTITRDSDVRTYGSGIQISG